MRISNFLPLLFALAGLAAAQETNFAVGPQYLMPAGAALLQPIATPSLSFDSAVTPQETNFAAGPQYLVPSSSPQFLEPIATPGLSFPSGVIQATTTEASAAPSSTADQSTYDAVSTTLDEARRMALYSIYYGYPTVSVLEIAFNQAAERGASTPSSIFDAGVVEFASPEALGEHGYGVTPAEAAARWKTHTVRARRVYTNEDLERLRPRD